MKPFIFQLPSTKIELVNENKIVYSTSSINAQPLFKNGFHHYINQSKDKLVLLNNDDLKGKTFYNIIENFNDDIPNYENNIKNANKKYIGIDINKDKLELWEILSIFGVAGDLYINDETYDPIIKAFYTKNGLKYKSLDDFKKSDVYININTPSVDIKQFEQAQFPILLESLSEISDGLNKGGNCIIKLYDTYTDVSVKLMKLISEMFTETYVYKPFITYGRDSTKYIIGLNYKDNFKNSNKLNEILKDMKDNKLNNIYNNFSVPESFEFVIKYMNIALGNYEHKMTNILVDYIKKSNYFGDLYHTCLENQKKTTEYWIETFYSSNYKKTKETLDALVGKTIKENNEDMIKMFKLMV
jgi:hypothetical protein